MFSFKVKRIYSGFKVSTAFAWHWLILISCFLSGDFPKTLKKLCLQKKLFDHRSSFIHFKAAKRNYAEKLYKMNWIKLFLKQKNISQVNKVCWFDITFYPRICKITRFKYLKQIWFLWNTLCGFLKWPPII